MRRHLPDFDPNPMTNDQCGAEEFPRIIQGGMGVGVSGWKLARAAAMGGALGVVSGTCLDTVLVRRLQDGDEGGHLRRAMSHFPVPEVSERILRRWFQPNGRAPGAPYRLLSMPRHRMSLARQQVSVLAAFVEVWLAREGHDRPVGINLLTKVQAPNLATLFGAMLGGVHYVLMGAGIPREIPGVLDSLAVGERASIRFDVEGAGVNGGELLAFDPSDHLPGPAGPLHRPRFLAIVSAHSLAITLARKSTGHVDGFIVEGPTAGGHNAPPRGAPRLNERGEPIYGDRDAVDLNRMRELGVPFWLAGGSGSPEGLRGALAVGATGIQVGTLFAYCEESGVRADLREAVLSGVRTGAVRIRTSPRASPTGYPFKIVDIDGIPFQNERRNRVCDLGYLRSAYRTAEGRLGYRCPAEPVEDYVAKGGDAADTVGRHCLCNALTANIGLGQQREAGTEEPPLLTSGDSLPELAGFFTQHPGYTAADVIAYLRQGLDPVAAGS